MTAMDLRQYDPAIARWVVQDPVIHHNMSPYNAFDNNPVVFADPSGADSSIMDMVDTLWDQTPDGGIGIMSSDGNGGFSTRTYNKDELRGGGGGRDEGSGAIFTTVLDAVIAFALKYNAYSIKNNEELYTTIYSICGKDGITYFGYVAVDYCSTFACFENEVKNSISKVLKIKGAISVASVHTHGAGDKNSQSVKDGAKSDSNVFSGTHNINDTKTTGDLNFYNSRNNAYGKRIDGYLITPINTILHYSPTTNYYLKMQNGYPTYLFNNPIFKF